MVSTEPPWCYNVKMVAAKDLMKILQLYKKIPANVRVDDGMSPGGLSNDIGDMIGAAAAQIECPVCFRRDLALIQLPDHWASGQCQRAAAALGGAR